MLRCGSTKQKIEKNNVSVIETWYNLTLTSNTLWETICTGLKSNFWKQYGGKHEF